MHTLVKEKDEEVEAHMIVEHYVPTILLSHEGMYIVP